MTNQIPHSDDTERVIIGTVLYDNRVMDQLSVCLDVADFYRTELGIIFGIFLHLHNTSAPIDPVTIGGELKRRSLFERVGGLKFIADITEYPSNVAALSWYIKNLRELSIRRKLIESCVNLAAMGSNSTTGNDEFFEAYDKMLSATSLRYADDIPSVNVRQIVSMALKELENRSRGKPSGVLTGYPRLDHMTSGIQAGNLALLAATPGMGKTSLALNIIANCTGTTSLPTMLYSFEMSDVEIVLRMLSTVSSVSGTRMRSGRLTGKDWHMVTQAANDLSSKQLCIIDRGDLKVDKLLHITREFKRKNGLGLVVVDYIQLIAETGKKQNREREVAHVSRTLKNIAVELRVPILALSQLNRDITKRTDPTPRLSDLRDSGSLEQDADMIMFIYPEPGQDMSNIDIDCKLLLLKQRSGPTGWIDLKFRRNVTHFVEIANNTGDY